MMHFLDSLFTIAMGVVCFPWVLGIGLYFKLKGKPKKVGKEEMIRRIKNEMRDM